MAEPWDITAAFARQLMQDAARTDESNQALALAPINQAMAMERLKQQRDMQLATLPQELAIRRADTKVGLGDELEKEKQLVAARGAQEIATSRGKTEAD